MHFYMLVYPVWSILDWSRENVGNHRVRDRRDISGGGGGRGVSGWFDLVMRHWRRILVTCLVWISQPFIMSANAVVYVFCYRQDIVSPLCRMLSFIGGGTVDARQLVLWLRQGGQTVVRPYPPVRRSLLYQPPDPASTVASMAYRSSTQEGTMTR